MNGSRRWSALGWLMAIMAVTPAWSVSTQRATVATQEEWLKGHANGVRVGAAGAVTLSAKHDAEVVVEASVVWAATPGTDGSVWLGTGSNGRLLNFDGSGKLVKTITLPELQVTALNHEGDTLYAGTSPDGAVYRIRPGRDPEEVGRPTCSYIWALVSGHDGELFAATGPEGIIYRLHKGEVDVFYDAADIHITSLLELNRDALVAGTAERGLVLRIDRAATGLGKASVLYDSGFKEVRGLALAAGGVVYAAVNGGSSTIDPASPAPGQANVTVSAGGGATAPPPPPPGGGLGLMPPEAFGDVSAEIVRIDPSGDVEVVLRTRGEVVHSLTTTPADELLIGTSKRLITPDQADRPAVITLAAEDEQTDTQVSALTRAGSRVFVATTDPSQLFVLADEPKRSASYLAEVVAAETIARWGALTTDAELYDTGKVTLETRSGSTLEPGESWTEWTAIDASSHAVLSPASRFLQWRMRLSMEREGTPPVVHSVSLAYLARNRRPQIKALNAYPPGVIFQKASAPPNVVETEPPPIPGMFVELKPANPDGSPPGPAMYRQGAQSLSWTTSDPDGDDVFVRLSLRSRDGGPWLRMTERPEDDNYAFDTGVLPDGWYVARIEASDADSNTAAEGLVAVLESDSFRVDNTPPQLTSGPTRIERQQATIRFDVTDAQSGLWKAEWSLDGGTFRPAAPVDGLCDESGESFEIATAPLLPGDHLVVLRVHDLGGNVAAGAARFSIR